jgi:hypothetical protein
MGRAADKYAPHALLKKTRRGEGPKQDPADLPIKTRLLGGVETSEVLATNGSAAPQLTVSGASPETVGIDGSIFAATLSIGASAKNVVLTLPREV